MSAIAEILARPELDRTALVTLLAARDPADVEAIRRAADAVRRAECGDEVFFRGIVEFSNVCACDCRYCGIRAGNPAVTRYTLDEDELVRSALWCADKGYGSVVLQSGERRDEAFVGLVERAVRRIKAGSVSAQLPDGLGITLSAGEQTPAVYARWRAAGAHRYLLRIETTAPRLFRAIHPEGQTLEARCACLAGLQAAGFQVGTGVMIGLPGQTVEDLADDVLFFRARDVDMIGMGPYIVHRQTPMAAYEVEVAARREEIYRWSLLMIAVVRLTLRDVNIAATTALQAMKPTGREEGLTYGANVIMPQLTPTRVRPDYQLYEGKPCLDESADQCAACLAARIRSVGRTVAQNQWGDAPHARRRRAREV
jgi:biotin synthase